MKSVVVVYLVLLVSDSTKHFKIQCLYVQTKTQFVFLVGCLAPLATTCDIAEQLEFYQKFQLLEIA